MRIEPKYIQQAIHVAEKSPQIGFRVGSVIVKRDEVLSTGVNHISNISLHRVFSYHAELHSLARARHLDLHGATIYIANISKGCNIKLAKPCIACAIALSGAGIQRAVYTIDSATFGVVDLDKEINTSDFYQAADGDGYRDR